jgi:hypothetical protein
MLMVDKRADMLVVMMVDYLVVQRVVWREVQKVGKMERLMVE